MDDQGYTEADILFLVRVDTNQGMVMTKVFGLDHYFIER